MEYIKEELPRIKITENDQVSEQEAIKLLKHLIMDVPIEKLELTKQGYYIVGRYHYLYTQDYEAMKYCYKRSHAKALCSLASYYSHKEKNVAEAERLYHKSILLGYTDALISLGHYKEGEESLKLFKKAADAGSLVAMYYIGRYYKLNGEYDEMKKWALKSYNLGHKRSALLMGNYYKDNGNFVEMEKWYRLGGDNGLLRLVNYYLLKKEFGKKVDLLKTMIENGCVGAMNEMATHLGLTGDPEGAKEMALKILQISKYNTSAMAKLGGYYQFRKDYEKMAYWYDLAEEHGSFHHWCSRSEYYMAINASNKEEEYYKKVSERGYLRASLALGMFYLLNNQIEKGLAHLKSLDLKVSAFYISQYYKPRDHKKEKKWLVIGAENGCYKSKISLMYDYLQKESVPTLFSIKQFVDLKKYDKLNKHLSFATGFSLDILEYLCSLDESVINVLDWNMRQLILIAKEKIDLMELHCRLTSGETIQQLKQEFFSRVAVN